MKLLAHITDKTLELTGEVEGCPPKVREAARAIIFNDEGKIAVIYTEKHGHHKIPGGGIDEGEDFHTAVKRECMEETGCTVKLRKEVVGKIEEERNKHNLKQISYCAVADVVAEGKTQFTEDEISDGYTAPEWVTLLEALKLFKTDKPKTYIGNYMHARDMKFIEATIEMFSKK